MSIFHASNGLSFERLNDRGQVRVGHVETVHAAPCEGVIEPYHYVWVWSVVVDPDVWASCVASVSASGETYDRWQQIRSFHAGQENKVVMTNREGRDVTRA